MISFAEKGTRLTDIEQNTAWVRTFFDALNCGDVEAVVNAYGDEGSCWTFGGYADFRGHELGATRAGSGAIFEAVLYLHSMIAEGERVAVEAESIGNHASGHGYNNL